MKLLIASDIHGSAYYCKKLIECYKKEKADKMLLLGDLLYHGPRNDLPEKYEPKAVIEMLNAYKDEILCVRGNCDTEVDQMVLSFPIMADYAIIATDKCTIYATHGHIFNEANLPPLQKGDILIHGHTHVPKYNVYENYSCLNPGSVSIPKESSDNSYILFDNEEFIFKNLDMVEYKRLSL